MADQTRAKVERRWRIKIVRRTAVAKGSKSLLAPAVVVAVAVLREGSEVALFLCGVAASDCGVAASDGGSAASLTIGGIMGLALGVAVCLLTHFGLMRTLPRALFATTTLLITLLAVGMAAQAAAFLQRATGSRRLIPSCGTVAGCCLSRALLAAPCVRSRVIPTSRRECRS